jgi:prophage antirepressor-like protein
MDLDDYEKQVIDPNKQLGSASIIPFDFETNAVRVVMKDGAPHFVAADVCRILEISKYRDAVARLDEDERVSVFVDTLGGQQAMTAVNESGLYALIFASRKPAAKRFRKWVTGEVLPAIRRDGSYHMNGSDQAELSAKRAHFATLPENTRAVAAARLQAMRMIDDLVADGMKISHAIAEVSAETGIGKRTLWVHRANVYMVASGDKPAALAPKWNNKRGMMAECHPEALAMFINLAVSGARVADCYRRMSDEAQDRGWQPIPCERTMRRVLDRPLNGQFQAGRQRQLGAA